MRAVLSIVLAGLLVTTPLKQVVAQVEQQDSTNVQDQRGTRLIRVPEVNPETAMFWRGGVIDPIDSTEEIAWPPEDFLDYLVWGVALFAFAALAVFIIIAIADEECTTIPAPEPVGSRFGNVTTCEPS